MGHGPLNGVKVVEMEGLGPVPFCGMMLADMGATVVRVGRAASHQDYADTGTAILDRGKITTVANLKSDADRAQVLELIRDADVLLEGFRPGAMERLGLGPDVCLGLNPALVYGRMTGYGQTGPMAQKAGHDLNYAAIGGAVGAIGDPSAPPPVPLNLIADYGGGGMFLLSGVLAGVIRARADGTGQVIDTAMTDGVPVLLSMFQALKQSGNWTVGRASNLLDGGRPYYRCYTCADGRFVAVGAIEEKFYLDLLRGVGLDASDWPQNDPARWPELERRLTEIFANRPRDEWTGVFAGLDACVTPVRDMDEAETDPHQAARGVFVIREGITQAAPAPRFGATPSEIGTTRALTLTEAAQLMRTG